MVASVVAIVTLAAGSLISVPVAAAKGGKKITLAALYVQSGPNGTEGSSIPVTIHLDLGGKPFRVGFAEDQVGGTGDQWHAAGWNAATVGTLLTGSPLNGRTITFDVNGEIDGPSPGALMTIGVIALLRGDTIKNDITMTGTINPDGTVGPVGGIPYKIDGVVQAHKKRMLIPLGERNSADDSGQLVDVVAAGQAKGVKVTEVADIYDAYKQFTGKTLPRPGNEVTPKLSNSAYDKLKALTDSWLADFQASVGDFNSLAPTIQQSLLSLADQANADRDTATSLQQQGLQAGAYTNAIKAAAEANAAVAVGRALQTYLTQGIDAFTSQINSSTAVEGKIKALFAELKTEKPHTLSQAGALIDAYSGAVDALAAESFGANTLAAASQATDANTGLQLAVVGAVYDELAGTLVEGAKQIATLGSSTGGSLKAGVDPNIVADFFRKAADANLTAFDTIIVRDQANQQGVSEDIFRNELSNADTDYALARAGSNVINPNNKATKALFGSGKNAAYGNLGGAVELYVRSAGLLDKYYSLGVTFDANFKPTGTSNEQALTSALDLGKSQVERSVAGLAKHKVDPTLQVGNYEAAGVEREGTLDEKLSAIADYLSAFVSSRVLAYLGGFEKLG